jgi:hypothetical protein
MDSIRVSEAPDPGSIPGEATLVEFELLFKSGSNSVSSKRLASNGIEANTQLTLGVQTLSFSLLYNIPSGKTSDCIKHFSS